MPGSTRDIANQSAPFNVGIEEPSSPVQRLWASSELEQQISVLVQRAFNVSLSVSRTGGSQITVHLGDIATPVSLPPTAEYMKEVQSLPPVQDQGDGIKTFVGMLLSIMTTDYPLLLIDEPETFLHPPQAYLLGQILAEQHDRHGQVVLVTHSADIIRGLTSVRAYADTVSIVRLTRSGTTNHVAQLATGPNGSCTTTRSSAITTSLTDCSFTARCCAKADSDCIYYRAVLDSNDTLDDGSPTSAMSLHFTHCGGKARLAKAVRALRSAKVPVVCIVDNDLLHNEREFEDLVEACGGNPDELRAPRNDVASAVEVKTQTLSAQQLKSLMEELAGLIESKTTTAIRPAEASEFARVLRSRSGWRDFKKGGYLLLGGKALTSYCELDTRLRELGIFIVPVGELERFHAEIPSDNKAEWLRTVLEQKLYEQSADACKFVTAVVGYIVSRQ